MSPAWILDALGPMDLTNRPMIPRIYVSLVIALVTPFAALSAQDAPMFRANLAHTGVYKSAAPRTLDVVKWNSSRGNRQRYVRPDGSHFFGAALPNGREYFYDQHVIALAHEWTMGSFLSSPVVSRGVVYCASMDGTLYALTSAKTP